MLITRLLSPLTAAAVALIASAGALATAYVAEYAFGHFPCTLCLWQRGPLWAAIAVALLLYATGRRHATLLLGILALLFMVEGGIAAFHIGVEQHWWAGTDSCSIAAGALTGTDAAASLREQLLGTPVARCDQVTWTFLGLSMATWNLPFSLLLAGWMLAATVRQARGD